MTHRQAIIFNPDGTREGSARVYVHDDGVCYVGVTCAGLPAKTDRTTLPEGWPVYTFSEVGWYAAVRNGLPE